jgi:hypothetical protein
MPRLLLAGALLLCGCTHVHIAAVDYTVNPNQIAVCGAPAATIQDLDNKAHEACPAGPKTLQCFEQAQGSTSTAVVNGRYGFATTSAVTGHCCVYSCPGAVRAE